MNDRLRDMEAILKDLYLTAKEHNVFFDQKTIYSYLIKRDVPRQYANVNINGVTFDVNGKYEKKEISSDDFFSRWIQKFEAVRNISVFCDPGWRYFCQFKNGDFSHVKSDRILNCIKIYIPLDYEHLYQGVTKIFYFLAKENICHVSKVSSKLRFDNVVVRLPSLEDAKKLQRFIDEDLYIQEGLMKGNAFAFQKNRISYAMDGMLSYNSYLSSLMSGYINEMAKKRQVNVTDINVSSFQQYVRRVTQNFSLVESYLSQAEKSSYYLKENVADAYGVARLIDLSLSSNDISNFEEHYYYLNNRKGREDLLSAIEENFQLEMNSVTEDPKESLLKEFILTTMKKYPLGYDPQNPNVSGFQYIYSYLNGNDKAVTRDQNLRNRMKNEISRDEVFQIINDSGIMGRDMVQMVANYVKITMLNDIISSMKKRMPNCAIENIEEFMKTNRLSLITNSVGNARQLVKTFNGTEIRHFLDELGMKDIEEYTSVYSSSYNNEYNRR